MFEQMNSYWEEAADPRTKGYFMVDITITGMLAFLLGYILTVVYIIPALMKGRKPFVLKNTIIVYNILMVLMNAYFFFKTLLVITRFGRELWNFTNPKADTSEQAMDFINTAHLYYLSKIVDFCDTFILALKKAPRISVLHIWHHVSMVGAGWMFMKYNPYMPTCAIIPIVNGFIHVVMYGYYALAALGPQYQKYLWWKKYLTQIQMIQLVIHVVWFTIVYMKQTDLPKGYLWANLGNAIALFVLFANFYLQSYRKSRKTK